MAWHKYGAQRYRGYHSKREASRALELHALEKAGAIRDLVEQPRYCVVPPDPPKYARGIFYVGDFRYTDVVTGKVIVEDCKGYQTSTYRLKRRLMYHLHGIEIVES